MPAFPIIMPIPMNSGPVSHEETNSLLGIWIVLNILSIISLLITLIKYILYRRRLKKEPNIYLRYEGRWSDYSFAETWDWCMIFIWACIILIFIGDKIGSLLP